SREAGLEHLHIELGCHRLAIVGAHTMGEAIHDLAPSPETVGGGPSYLRKAGHTALEGMAVEVGHARKTDRMTLIADMWRRASLDGGDDTSVDIDPDIARE